MRPGSSSLVHCRPMRLPVPQAAFASCGQKPKSFYSSTVRRRPIFRQLLASEIDGCIPLFASPDSLVDTLQQIITADLRILVLKSETCSSMPRPTAGQEEGDELGLPPSRLARSDDAKNGAIDRTTSRRIPHDLSEREEEILKSVVKGHSNKMIARTCGVTDATIKVHMKSILRKIRVANRTQAAIWALEQGYGADAHRRSPALRPLHGLAAT